MIEPTWTAKGELETVSGDEPRVGKIKRVGIVEGSSKAPRSTGICLARAEGDFWTGGARDAGFNIVGTPLPLSLLLVNWCFAHSERKLRSLRKPQRIAVSRSKKMSEVPNAEMLHVFVRRGSEQK
jgi:hypothetical protein